MSVRIKTGDTENIEVGFIRNTSGAKITGLTDLFIRVKRSNGDFLDWSDNTFKASGWTTINRLMVETNEASIYELVGGFNTSLITNANANDNYIVIPLQTPGTNAVLPDPGELKVGQWVDTIPADVDAELSTQHGAGDWQGAAGTVELYESEPDRV